MAKSCPTCGKGTIIVGHYSNRVRATKFNPTGNKRKYPNLQWAPLADGSELANSRLGRRIKICTKCMKVGKHLEIKFV